MATIPSRSLRVTLAGAMLLLSAAMLGPAITHAAQQSPAQEPAAPAQAAAPADHPEFPMGPGRDTVLRLCSKCHSPNNVLAAGQDQAGWEATITQMVGFGLQGTDEEFTEALGYLSKNFPATPNPKINVNVATASQLSTRLALTTDEGQKIVAYRTKNGNFKTLDDLKKVPDVDARKLDAKKDNVTF